MAVASIRGSRLSAEVEDPDPTLRRQSARDLVEPVCSGCGRWRRLGELTLSHMKLSVDLAAARRTNVCTMNYSGRRVQPPRSAVRDRPTGPLRPKLTIPTLTRHPRP